MNWLSSKTTKHYIQYKNSIIVISDYSHFYINTEFANKWDICGTHISGIKESLVSVKTEKEARKIIQDIWGVWEANAQ